MSHGPFGLDGAEPAAAPDVCTNTNATPINANASTTTRATSILVFMPVLLRYSNPERSGRDSPFSPPSTTLLLSICLRENVYHHFGRGVSELAQNFADA